MSGATQSLAAQAAALWQQHDYKQCITVLKQLQGQNPDDCKVRHNLALAEYHAGGCCQAQQLLAALQAVKNTAETRAKEVAERLQRAASPTASSPAAASGSGKGAASPTKGAAAAAAADVAAASVMHVEDTDASLVTLNMAAIHFQMKQHAAALALLEELYRDIEPISEVAALRVCLLLLEIYLAADQPEKAAGVLGYVEKTYGLTTDRSDDKVSSEQHSDADTAADPDGMSTPKHSTMAAELAKVEGSPGSAALGSGGDAEDLAASFGRSLLLGSQGMLDGRTATQGDRHIKVAGLEVGQLVHIYKARLHLQTHNLKAAKREIKAILAADPTSPQGLSLKAQLEYLRHNYRKAAKLLTAVPTASRDSPPTASNASTSGSGPPQPQPPADPAAAAMSRVTMLCNMGAVQHSQGKHHTAALCFSTALKAAADAVAAGSAEFSDSQQGSGRQSQSVAGSSTSSQNADQDQRLPLPVFARDVRLQVVYNAGLQALMLRRYASGLQCFEEASAAFYNRPLLWLRMADKEQKSASGAVAASVAAAKLERRRELATILAATLANLAPSAGSAGSVGTSRAASPAVVVELTGPAARRDLLVNLASVYALQGDLVQAQQAAAKAATLDPACPQALLMLVYVELSRGNTGSALQLLKQQRMAV
ncbi:hypothetical protein WJX72_001596 [[Myrmecia] bisecta]|uniref:CCR4-NOT transcription complex subunit 10 n=1 Tax=[Myrmecia] bisecta TaxID=41462 RepID=A0AAW1P7K9_9CHLO